MSQRHAPAVRTAKEWGKRPTQVITGDEHYGHRDAEGNPTGNASEWIRWDYILAEKVQTITDLTGSSSVPQWVMEAPNVEISADKKIDKFEAAKARKTSGKNYKQSPGEYYVARVELRGGTYPTLSEWYESKREAD